MKKSLLFALSFCALSPGMAFSQTENNLKIRPFIGYDLTVADASYANIKAKDHLPASMGYAESARIESADVNYTDSGSFVFGLDIGDIMAITINPYYTGNKLKLKDRPSDGSKSMGIDGELDFYLTRNSDFKPYFVVGTGYMDISGYFQTSGGIFNVGFGLRQYFKDHFFLGAKALYGITSRLKVEKAAGESVEGVTMRISQFSFLFGGGYRF